MVLDARFLPNPHWEEELRPLTGLDDSVKDYVIARPETHGFIERASGLLVYLVPLYLAGAETQLIVAVGCTGGRHRSVALAEAFAAPWRKSPRWSPGCATATWTADSEPDDGDRGRRTRPGRAPHGRMTASFTRAVREELARVTDARGAAGWRRWRRCVQDHRGVSTSAGA